MRDGSQLLGELLQNSSRTFALAIPLLEQPCRDHVSIAYLLLRIADTLEDAAAWPLGERLIALAAFSGQLDERAPAHAERTAREWLQHPPTSHPGHLAVLAHMAELLTLLNRLPRVPRDLIVRHIQRTAMGMLETLRQYEPDGRVVMADLPGLRAYCYIVAGIVGELLTELFCLQCGPLAARRELLLEHASALGEGLQLVNILKDAQADLVDGRSYLPADTPTHVHFTIAFEDLRRGRRYLRLLEQGGASPGVIAFTSAPLLLAEATLAKVQRLGPGAKLTREELWDTLRRVQPGWGDTEAETRAHHAACR
jgi:farnesyl-diphosphate farnesyltransferase